MVRRTSMWWLLATAGLLVSSASAHEEPVVLQLKWHHQFQFAGYYAAEARGFYAAEGLDVVIREGNAQTSPIEEVRDGRAHFGVSDSDIVLARLGGTPLVACAAIFQHSPYVFMSRADHGIRTPADLVGKTVMMSDDQGAAQLRAMLLDEGIDPASVNEVSHSWDIEELIAGRVDAISAYAMVEPTLLLARGVEPAVLRSVDYGIDFYGDTLFTTTSLATHDPERVEAFTRASLAGWQWALANPDETIDLILGLEGVSARGITREQLAREADGMLPFILPEVVELGHMNPGRWERIAATFHRVGLAAEPTPARMRGFVFTPKPAVDPRLVRWLVALLSGVLLLVLVIGAWILTMRRQVASRTKLLREEVELRRRAEAGLRERERTLLQQAELLDKAQDAIIVCDLDYRVTYWNASAERRYGWSVAEALGRPVHEMVSGDGGQLAQARALLWSQGAWLGELRQQDRAGRELTVEARWTLVRDADSASSRILDISTDVTAQRQLEQHLLRAQRLESIGTLAGGIAHDLNNVLAPIVMGVELLSLSPHETEDAEVLAAIGTSARRGADMVSKLLSFARGVDGRRIAVAPADLLRELGAMLKETLPRNINLEFRIDPEAGEVVGDPTQLSQVLLNLCINARDAMPNGGSLVVSASPRTVMALRDRAHPDARPGRYLEFAVADTGCGMTSEVLDKIFDPFFTTKEHGKGTGLGLSTSLAIVRSHGGVVHVDSSPGRGSRFEVLLPAVEAGPPEPAVALSRPPTPRGRGEEILVVDDEPAIREMAKRMLEVRGYRIELAANGAEAIALFARDPHRFGLVVTDLMMPVMDGAAAIRALRQLDPGLPIVAMSGLVGDAVSSFSVDDVNAFLPKPFTGAALLQAVSGALENPAKA